MTLTAPPTGMVMLSVHMLGSTGVGHYTEYKERITSEDLAGGRLRPNNLNAFWIEGERRGVCVDRAGGRINHDIIVNNGDMFMIIRMLPRGPRE